MRINEMIENTKAKVAYSRRRAIAVREHGKTVVTTGIAAARTVATVAVQNLKSVAVLQKQTVLDSELSIAARARKLRSNALRAAASARDELAAAVKDGYLQVKDRAEHVTAVTRKEQSIENKIGRKAKKARKIADQAA